MRQGGALTEVEYYVRSSVLGGRVVTELNRQGQKQKGFVYLGGEVIAEQGGFDFRLRLPPLGPSDGEPCGERAEREPLEGGGGRPDGRQRRGRGPVRQP